MLAELMIETAKLEEARRAVRPLVHELDLAQRLEPFAGQRWGGEATGRPTLHLDDFSGIPFLVDITGVEEYQHRARLRAVEGDLFGTVTPLSEGYEEYCRRRLGLGDVESVPASPVGSQLDLAAACMAGGAWRTLVERTRTAGGLAIHPFMGIAEVWELGRRLAEETGEAVEVIAPAPPVTWIANDKAAFAEVVERVLGSDWLVEAQLASDVAGLAKGLVDLAGRHRRVALKRLRCASAMGNAVFNAESLRGKEIATIEEEVRAFLERTEWEGDESVLAVVWEETDLSPSTQLWIPPLEVGPPRLDGIYEQILRGERRVFIGSRPSTLSPAVNSALAAASLRVAAGLQELGYVGRCSFDLLVLGNPEGDFELRFTECNGRWGGTSTPMALLDRLVPGRRPPYRAQDVVDDGLVGATFLEVLDRVGDQAFDAATGKGRFIFYNTGPLAKFGKVDVIALGASQPEAEEAMQEELPRLLGL